MKKYLTGHIIIITAIISINLFVYTELYWPMQVIFLHVPLGRVWVAFGFPLMRLLLAVVRHAILGNPLDIAISRFEICK